MTDATKFVYPTPRRDETIIDEHFGTKVPDPYRWMEDPEAEETKTFVKEQNEVSLPFIQACPDRERITKDLTKLKDYPKFSIPSKHGDKYFINMNSGLQNQSVMYKQESIDSEPVEFLDPNKLSTDGTVALVRKRFSHDGSLLAYGLSTSGSDWFTINIKEVSTGIDLPERLEKAKFSSIEWTKDGKGFFYGCYPDTEDDGTGTGSSSLGNQKVFYHRINTDQSVDVKCVEFNDHPKWMLGAEVSDCGQYVLVTTHQECRDNLLYFTKLKSSADITGLFDLKQVVYKFEHDYEYITNTGSKFLFRTNRNSPNYQLVLIDFDYTPTADNIDKQEPWPMTTLIPECEDSVLEWSACVHQDKLILCYLKDVKSELYIHDLATGERLHQIPLDIGSVTSVFADKRYSEFFFMFNSTIIPSISYRVDMTKSPPGVQVLRETEIPGFDRSHYNVEQVFYNSKDGTRVPMFIASRKDCKRDGSEPCLLYGYGGFNISINPSFADGQLFFVQHYGYYAIANIRGGGEYGEKWHNAGRLLNKQNCFDDFVAAAEFLVDNKYTSRDKLAIKGGSNGGLLVGACLNQRPDLFGAGIAAVGVMDMLRFHKFTVGYAWCSDFGNPDKKEDFENCMKYSPLHTIPQLKGSEQYPATLLTTADHDDRVVPSHSLKFIAELQHNLGTHEGQKNPLLIRVETKAGHGFGKPTSKVIEESTDVLSFLTQALHYSYKELPA